MKTSVVVLSLLLTASALAIETPPNQPEKHFQQLILSAARAGDGPSIGKLVAESFKRPGALEEGAVKEGLDGLVRSGELSAFTVLLGEMRQTKTRCSRSGDGGVDYPPRRGSAQTTRRAG